MLLLRSRIASGHDVLCSPKRHTAFPCPLLRTQAERVGADPANLGPNELLQLIEPLAMGVAGFNAPEAGLDVHLAL